MNNTIKLHFKNPKRAMAASVNGAVFAGKRDQAGSVLTWIAHVAKANPHETAQQAAKRWKTGVTA